MGVNESELLALFSQLGEQYTKPATLYLLGGTALMLLGSTRPTLDVDYVGTDLAQQQDELQQTLNRIAAEMHIQVEAVPLEDFIPIPRQAAQRHLNVGQYNHLAVYVFDPYSIALSKIERGFESDLEDVAFLLKRNLIALPELEQTIQEAIGQSKKFDMDAQAMYERLDAIRKMI